MTAMQGSLFLEIEKSIQDFNNQLISEERKIILQPLIDVIQTKYKAKEKIRINFICTHNSRRSHFSQVWAQTMAHYFNIPNVFCYSGGTESTTLFPVVVEVLRNSGFRINTISQGENPIYSIKYFENEPSIIGFSKELTHDFNPKSEFVAVMTCDSANEACPFISGAEKRISIMFEDPKVFDNTPQQFSKYNERNLQIANELWYVFSQITR